MARFSSMETRDIRFPTSRSLDGSDAMNPEPDYSAAYLIIRTDADDGIEGHGFVFTTGRGNEIQRAAIDALGPWLVGRDVDEVLDDLGTLARDLSREPQLRWLGPEKGVIHMAVGAVVNALWDLKAKRADKPLWRLLADMSPEEIVALVDFRYLSDALTRDEALDLLARAEPGRADRIAALERDGYPAYTTSPGWLGYSDDKLATLAREAVADGFSFIKLKVGASAADDARRMAVAREAVGPAVPIAIDANQRWDAAEAVERVNALSAWRPYWIEEPTSPDDILGHRDVRAGVGPVMVATGEHVHNRVVFKQLIASGAIDVVQIDACRVGGVGENVAILLLAAKYGLPVCPHAGGVGLCELVQHLAMFDYVAVSGTTEGRAIEYVDHLHEHFVHPVEMRGGRYAAPRDAGFGAEMLPDSLAAHEYPGGEVWRTH